MNKYDNMTSEILKKLNKNEHVEPMSDEEISKIQLAKNRTNTEFIALPEILKIVLSIDKNFSINETYPDKRLLKFFFERMDDNGNVHSARISDELFWMFEGADLKGQKLLWNDIEEMPALIELAASGDQRVYLYMGEKYNEEYPIARFDNEPCVWLTEASLLNHLLSCFDRDELSKDQKIAGFFNKDTQAELTEAQKRNEAFTKKEWWHKKFRWPG